MIPMVDMKSLKEQHQMFNECHRGKKVILSLSQLVSLVSAGLEKKNMEKNMMMALLIFDMQPTRSSHAKHGTSTFQMVSLFAI